MVVWIVRRAIRREVDLCTKPCLHQDFGGVQLRANASHRSSGTSARHSRITNLSMLNCGPSRVEEVTLNSTPQRNGLASSARMAANDQFWNNPAQSANPIRWPESAGSSYRSSSDNPRCLAQRAARLARHLAGMQPATAACRSAKRSARVLMTNCDSESAPPLLSTRRQRSGGNDIHAGTGPTTESSLAISSALSGGEVQSATQ